MTDDEKMERNMRFIVEQQAQFAADMQQVREVLHTQSQAIVTTVSMIGRLAETQAAHDARIAALETKMVELAEAGRETESRLNAFITFVEKYTSSRDGGGEKTGNN